MRKLMLSTIGFFIASACYAQRGINTANPKATLDIVASKTDASTPEGAIVPRLTGDQIKGKDNRYNSDQIGTIIYATTAVGSSSTKTQYMTTPGLYYFDGSLWQRFCPCTSSN